MPHCQVGLFSASAAYLAECDARLVTLAERDEIAATLAAFERQNPDAVRADVDAVSAEFRHLAAMNQSAGARYAAIGRRVGDAHVFADKVRKVQETGIAPQLARLEEIEASVGSLENVANALDARCAELERRLARVVNGEVGNA